MKHIYVVESNQKVKHHYELDDCGKLQGKPSFPKAKPRNLANDLMKVLAQNKDETVYHSQINPTSSEVNYNNCPQYSIPVIIQYVPIVVKYVQEPGAQVQYVNNLDIHSNGSQE